MENKTSFYRVILKCPLNDPLDDCIISKYRNMSIVELIEESRQMTSSELENLLDQHSECVRKRKSNKMAS